MKNRPLFSLITVTYNPGEGLRRTVESVKAQRYRDFEHVIKDGGSTDGSLEAYAQDAPGYAPLIARQADGGIYDAMNQALSHATGRFVLFLNAGDSLFDAQVLESVAAVLRLRPDLGLVYGDYFSETLRQGVKSPSRLTRFALFRNTLCHQSCFAQRECIERLGGFDTSLRVLADYDLLLRMLFLDRVPFAYLGKPLASCMGGGFSARLENVRLGSLEARIVRDRYFPRGERILHTILRAATLPQLRTLMMRSERLGPLRHIYTKVANFWNK
jgi:glycosyltransferase involved in cell wall biosynthesis